jgi:hypothetical protein
MTIYAILLPHPEPAVAAKIVSEFGADALSVNETQWLVSASGTTQDITKRLGIFDPENPNATPTGSAIVFATSGYFGRAPTNIWEWLKVKLETPAATANAKTA